MKISSKTLKAIATFCSKDETRFMLSGVWILTIGKELVLIASDGRRIILLRDNRWGSTGPKDPVMIPASSIKKAFTSVDVCQIGKALFHLDWKGKDSRVEKISKKDLPKVPGFAPMTCEYANKSWKDGFGSATVNPALLKDFVILAEKLPPAEYDPVAVKFYHIDETSPIMMRIHSRYYEGIALLMPLRASESCSILPPWISSEILTQKRKLPSEDY